ncbi:phosphoribosyltransferase-like protein [Clostridium beijerinckii]|uniref:phosphoribosyltransferase-like protein n=1 Tax=Clostridium beijerinckii TaxID=1520 RepID=UPI00098C4294|nr:hypothetical protein [Clostridium beijerinckii]NRT80936.1 hypoxanthine phosphoribosyltransferase [Clostridium beijerinckii]OOM48270.1 hypothetical protein CBEIJ_24490 [Clostridium beijerinckii]
MVFDKKIEDLDNHFREEHDFINLKKKIDNWFTTIDDDRDKEIYLQMLEKYRFYSRKNIICTCRKLHEKVTSFDSEVETTIFLPMLSPDGRSNHSFEIHNIYREANRLNKKCFPADINTVINTYPLDQINNICFVDDMTGSGRTIKESIRNIFKKNLELATKNIYILLMEVPEEIDRIEKAIQSEVSDNIKILYVNLHEKALKEGNLFKGKELKEVKQRLEKYEKLVNKNNRRDMFGFDKSEFLLSFYYDTPNNTISSLWKHRKGWEPPFNRGTSSVHNPSWIDNIISDEKGAKSLKSRVKNRKELNYNAKILRNR